MVRVNGIVEKIVGLIDGGLLKQGDRLLSVRAGAAEHGVSKNTMAEAYSRLVALGHLEARQGSGYYVAHGRRPPVEQRPSHVAEALDFVALLREQLVRNHAVRIGDGRLPPSWMGRFELGSGMRHIVPSGSADQDHDYRSPWGFYPLRERISLTLGERSIKGPPGQILLTQGANHAFDLIIRQLLKPGDTALVDSPGYYPLFGKLRLAGVEMVGVRRLDDGPCLDDLAAKAAACNPRIFFTQSVAHNPTGGSIISSVAHRLLQIAEQHGIHVVEDDPFAELVAASSPRLAALDGLQRVIYVGSYAKVLPTGLRVGYVAAKQAIADSLCDLKMLTIINTSTYLERIVHSIISGSQYLRHLRKLKIRIEDATRNVMLALEEIGIKVASPPAGGYYIWGQLPLGTDEMAVARSAAEKGIFLAPGTLFVPDRSAQPPAMRINVAYAGDPRFIEFMRDRLNA